jgi:hypothetical protein
LLSNPSFNGGFTATMATVSNSPGINQALVNQSTPEDQRLKPRYQTADYGSYELLADLIFADGFE